ncbi:ubiquinone/menaquinone biosynthesis methyltransferase [Candidatus Sumerlaeota bacterium]|nr:ubiquinone/menaquinone biosynthesis methyltransferase [Candidatus Sumerlaeota bacterium]MBI3737256.1 ubiquinone/menaquinone biosynthesis methyltransferase [Candidatus Sumerlaeota bacterium]
MFGQITPTYDRLNHLFSGWLDYLWRRRMAWEMTEGLDPCRAILDVATGTGDLAHALRGRAPSAAVTGLDFTRPMLLRAAQKYGASSSHLWIEGDGTNLPFADGSFDACCVAFGLRNMADRRAGLAEMRRVTRPGGRVGVLEFSQPSGPIIRRLYHFYSMRVMPRAGKILSGSDAYLYLPNSIRAFWTPDELASQLRGVGLVNVRWNLLTFGVAAIHLGEVPG